MRKYPKRTQFTVTHCPGVECREFGPDVVVPESSDSGTCETGHACPRDLKITQAQRKQACLSFDSAQDEVIIHFFAGFRRQSPQSQRE